ncbi:NTP transferase domain-containing protein [Cellulosimicrobium funkei]|nr:NTP transferase domain-containing protein [Cellulosimicrobium funkei]
MVGALLAAGAGRRLGRGPKALLSLDHGRDGEPLVVRAARALVRGGCDEVVVVVGASGRLVRDALEAAWVGTPEPGRHRVVVNPDWESGLGSSFRAGIDAADRLLSAPGDVGDGSVLLALVDQPGIGEAAIARLLDAAAQETTGRRVTAAGYPDPRGRLVRGHPLVFPLALARQAAALAAGDAAGRVWLREHPEAVDVVDMGPFATGRDLDTPVDLQWWTRRDAAEGSRVVRT